MGRLGAGAGLDTAAFPQEDPKDGAPGRATDGPTGRSERGEGLPDGEVWPDRCGQTPFLLERH